VSPFGLWRTDLIFRPETSGTMVSALPRTFRNKILSSRAHSIGTRPFRTPSS
jgi:hypothetical protein